MKAKPILLVVITLAIGFVLGMLTSAQLRFHRLQPVRLYFSEERFREGFFKVIQPDEKQKAEIEKILQKYARINGEMQSDFRKQLDSTMKEFRKEVDSKLTKEQLSRLKEMDDRRQEMIRKNWKDRRDSSGGYDRRPSDRGRRQFQDDDHMRPGSRPMPPEGMPPTPPGDTVSSTDRK
jgi:hypothetical protein